jgi:hypothetical protein
MIELSNAERGLLCRMLDKALDDGLLASAELNLLSSLREKSPQVSL